ncbi:MAG: hypothetical protein KF814_11930 [Nitrospiraceae bacterium]|nr:hypothetical protein [Nitrospiraceae bacterium]
MPSTALQLSVSPEISASTDSGFIVLTMARRILHLNDRARTWLCALSDGEGPVERGLVSPLPNVLVDLFHAVLAEMEKRIAGEDWRHFEMRTVCVSTQGLVLARGFGMPEASRRQQSRIVLLLQHDPL